MALPRMCVSLSLQLLLQLKSYFMPSPAGRFALLVGGLLFLASCVTTATLARPAEFSNERSIPRRVIVTLVDDSLPLHIGQAVVERDSIFGVIEGSAAPGFPLKRIATPLTSVAKFEVTRFDGVRTLLLPLLPLVAVATSFWVLAE